MTLHVISLPHTQTTAQYLTCAYTQKVIKFCRMMRAQGFRVVLYSNDQNEAECDEHVTLLSEGERAAFFGNGFDTVHTPLLWDPAEPYWQMANTRAIAAIKERAEERDILCIIGGNCQQPVSDAFPAMTSVEWGVGYEGIYTRFCAFESYAWMHHVYGLRRVINGRAFDAVIPNFFNAEDFEVAPWATRLLPKSLRPSRKSGYLLFLGRVIERKGPHIAAEIAQRLEMPLVVAGPGASYDADDTLRTPEGVRIEGNVEYVGEVGVEDRKLLMSRADAMIVPTIYVEPFGGVAVEAMLSGTPVVASDWGSFTEIVTSEVGRRFHTLREGCAAVEEAIKLDPDAIRAHALARYSLEAVGPQFTSWLDRLDTLWGRGWYT